MNIDWSHEFCNPVPGISFPPSPWSAYFNAPGRNGYNDNYENPGDPAGHKGLDLHAPSGADVISPHPNPATVGFAGRSNPGAGNVVVLIEPADGGWWVTRHLHLLSWEVKAGDIVQPGEVVAAVGCTGQCNRPHDHFEVRWLTEPFNPNVDSVRQGTPLDPIRFGVLVRACDGQDPLVPVIWPGLLCRGDKDPAVRVLRGLLLQAGYKPHRWLRLSKFGSGVEKAVKAVQRQGGAEVDGVVGPETKNLLLHTLEAGML